MNKIPRCLPLLLGLLLILFGVFVFLYPVVSTYQAQQNQVQIVEQYEEKMEVVEDAQIQAARQKAMDYNASLAGDAIRDPFIPGSGYALPQDYQDTLNLNGDGIMGYLEIPKLGIRLPIGHGTSDEVLERKIGHIESTALPIGGQGGHTVLTGHRGLPSAELLTRLDEMEIGDLFYLRVLDETLAYRVDQINTVLPTQLEHLQADPDLDLCTVLTCTPYGINSHRLLVRGQRTEYIPEEHAAAETTVVPFSGLNAKKLIEGTLLGFVLLALVLILWAMIHILRKYRRKGRYSK